MISKLVRIVLTAVAVALLDRMLKGGVWPRTDSTKKSNQSNGQVIEIDDYEIVDENQNPASEGHKVIIQ